MCGPDLFLGVIAILFPPLAVWVKRGLCSADSVINILLCFLGYVPGLFHAWYIIAKFPDETDDYERVQQHDYERGGQQGGSGSRVHYVFVQAPAPQPHPQSPQQQPKHNAPVNYGTAATNAGSSSNHHDEAGGSDDHAPPTYAEAVKGDHKIQSDE
ncbi:hypothetical protein F4680DRAFT_434311 [Xylaria scruposa]|nr:hypothetical protein F4680DRAFT_434311 [Xylaria scruposa]